MALANSLEALQRRYDAAKAEAARMTQRVSELRVENERLAALVGVHDPAGADHMEDAARLAVENDELRSTLYDAITSVVDDPRVFGVTLDHETGMASVVGRNEEP